eukprot:scaffold19168_cov107-Isochrysis_galbana.AAC.8
MKCSASTECAAVSSAANVMQPFRPTLLSASAAPRPTASVVAATAGGGAAISGVDSGATDKTCI